VYSRTDLDIWFLHVRTGLRAAGAAMAQALQVTLPERRELLNNALGTSRDVFWYGREVSSRSGRWER
jgi:hypothetical protein